MMNWNEIWITLFGTTEWLNLNIGFWVSMNVVLLMVILMHVIFWGRKPRTRQTAESEKSAFRDRTCPKS
ncbi:MAG: hypothetical protein Q4A63_01380 [Butyricicoccus pullicaecorum]|nr:hypothetical protein [Butyricicoccus pullicaecorum]